MDSAPTDLVSRIIFRAVDEISAVLKGIAGEMDAVEARVRQTEATYAAAVTQLEGYEARMAGLSKSMAAASAGGSGSAETEAAAAMAKAEQQAHALAVAEGEVATQAGRAGSASAKSASDISKTEAASAKAKKSLGELAKSMMLIGAAAAAIIAGTAVMASHFQSDMELVRTQAGASQAEVHRMTQAVLDMSVSVGTGPDRLAQGLYHIESAGFRGAQALRILRAAAEGAAVGHADLEATTQALIALTAARIDGVHSETQAMGELNAIVGAGDMRMQGLAEAMSTGLVSSAKVFGLSIRDVGAALATLTDNAVPPVEAATRLRMTFSLMGAPSKTAAKALAQIGMSATQMADDMRKPDGLLVALQDLKKHLIDSGLTASQQAQVLSHAFGGGRTSAAIMTLIDQLDRVKSKYADIAAGAKKFGSDWAATQQTVAFQMKQVEAAVQKIAIELGSALLPALHNVLLVILPVIDAFSSWAAGHEAIVAAALAVAVAIGAIGVSLKAILLLDSGVKMATESWKVFGSILDVFKARLALVVPGLEAATVAEGETGAAAAAATPEVVGLAAAVDLLLGPVGLIIAGVAALVIGFKLAYDHIRPFHDAVNGVLSVLGQLASAIGEKLLGIFNMFKDALGFVGNLLDVLCSKIGITKGDLLLFVPVIGPIIEIFRHWHDIIQIVGDILGWLGTLIGHFLSAVAKMASGIPILGGLFSKLGSVLEQVAGAFGHVGSSIDAYAHQGQKAQAQTNAMIEQHRRLRATLGQTDGSVGKTTSAVKKLGSAFDSTKEKSRAAVDAMIADARRLETAWSRAGRQTAAAATLAAGAALAAAHGDGSAASRAIASGYTNAGRASVTSISAPQLTFPADAVGKAMGKEIADQIKLTVHDLRGSNVQVLDKAGMGAGTSGMAQSLAGFKAAVAQLPPSLRSAMAPVIAQYAQQIKALEAKYAQDVRNEDTRHIQALAKIHADHEQAIQKAEAAARQARANQIRSEQQQLADLNRQHQQAMQQANASAQAALRQHAQSLSQTVKQHEQAIRSALSQHEQRLKSLHDAYIQKLDSIHGKNAAERRQQADQTYQREVARENQSYQRRIQAEQSAIARAKQNYDDFLKREESAAARRQAASDASYRDHADKIKQALEKHIRDLQQSLDRSVAAADAAEKKKLASEDALHKKHLADLKTAFGQHAKQIEAALKKLSSPAGLWDKLQSQVNSLADKALKSLDEAVLTHSKNIDKDVQAVVRAEKAQQKLTAAEEKAALLIAKATGDYSTVISQISQKLQTQWQQAVDKVTFDILKHGQATQQDIDAVVLAAAKQKAFADAQEKATIIIARATGDYSTVVSEISKKLSTDYQQALDKVTDDILEHGQATQADIQAVQQAAAASAKFTEAQWEAAYATGDAATKADMLAQRFQHLISEAQTVQGAQSSVDSAQLQVLSDKSTQQVNLLSALVKDTENQTAIMSAQAAVSQAVGDGQLAAIKDQSAIIQARAAIQQATDAASLTVGQDQLRIALDQLAVDQSAAHWQTVIAQDQLKIAMDQRQVDQANARAQATIDRDKLAVSQDAVKLAQDQLKLTMDQLVVQADIASSLGSVNDYSTMIHSDLASIQADQAQSMADQYALAQDTANAAQVAAEGQLQIAQDQQQLAADQAAANANSLQGQMQIAEDQNKLAADQAAQQLSATNTTNNLLNQQLQQQEARDQEMISYLEQLVKDSRSAVSARPARAASTTNKFFNNLSGDRAATVVPG